MTTYINVREDAASAIGYVLVEKHDNPGHYVVVPF